VICGPVAKTDPRANLLDTWLRGYKRAEKLSMHHCDIAAQASFAGAARGDLLKKIGEKDAGAC
jgi:hypothetical protein